MAIDVLVTDRAESWIVAACCCFSNLMFYGISRLSGIMLVAATQTFHVSRASAAVPFSLSTAIRNLAGVCVGHLGHKFGVGPVVAAGCLIASIGSGMCFFAKDMQWLTICWGGIFGFGFGLATCLLPLAINQNFVKHNGAASGISYSGSYIGSFIFPPVIVWLLNSYGLQGTFLIISGGILHVLVAALLLKEPKIGKKHTVPSSSKEDVYGDCYDSIKNVNLIRIHREDCEMWKQNLNIAFLDSQYNFKNERDKVNNTLNSSLKSPVQLPQHLFEKSTPGNIIRQYINVPRSELTVNHPDNNLFPILFEDCEYERAKRDCENFCSKINSSAVNITIHDASLVEEVEDSNYTTKCSYTCPTKSPRTSSKKVPISSKVHLHKLTDNRLLSKKNYKAKHKLKLQKLKRAILTSILKNRFPLEESSENGEVKLTSFKYLQSFICPHSFNKTVSNICLVSAVSHKCQESHCKIPKKDEADNVSDLIISEKLNFDNGQVSSRTSRSVNELPVLDTLLENNKLCIDFPLGGFEKKTTKNDCDLCIHQPHHPDFSFTSVNKTDDGTSSSKSSVCDDSSSFSKTEESQSSYIPTSSSDLYLQCATKSKSKRKNLTSHSKSTGKIAKRYFADLLHMLRKPLFALIAFTMSIQTFIVVCVVTTIEDYAKDMGISEDKTHYALMALSVSNLIGTLTLGSITDRGFISRHLFLSLCFFGMCLSLVAVSLVAHSLPSLLSLISVYGLLESGVIITFPILIKQFVKGERRQAVAIASSNVLSAPTVMLVPMLIGHFRDNIGCYSGLFQLLGATSFICAVLWLVSPSMDKKRSLRKKSLHDIATKC